MDSFDQARRPGTSQRFVFCDLFHDHRIPRVSRNLRGNLPVSDPRSGASRALFSAELPPRGSGGALLALRGFGLDFGIYVRVPSLVFVTPAKAGVQSIDRN